MPTGLVDDAEALRGGGRLHSERRRAATLTRSVLVARDRRTGVAPRGLCTEIVDNDGVRRIVPLRHKKAYDPLEDSRGTLRRVLDRLTLHLSIGQAF